MFEINETHDSNLKSWVESANSPETDFPVQNLPFCVFARACTYENVRVGVAIGDFVLDLYSCYECCLFDDNGVLWRQEHFLNSLQIENVRIRGAISFGSCSFVEPIEDLQEIGLL